MHQQRDNQTASQAFFDLNRHFAFSFGWKQIHATVIEDSSGSTRLSHGKNANRTLPSESIRQGEKLLCAVS
ncbi:hypothetical protein [Undibacterium sp. TJN19]|uniref:hypothetical protein n=1 Tax=Undibacterium sp. TJN19 TaxID=3413055 RepID=UPI003BF530E6